MRSVTGLVVCGAIVLGLWQSQALGAIGASVTYTSQQLSPSSYQYSFTVQNTSTSGEAIGTFWFGWIPNTIFGYAYDFLPHLPTGVNSPTGWTGAALVDGIAPPSGGGGTVEWYDTGTALPAGQSLSGFSFTSSDAPTTMMGTSFFGGYPVATSWVYQGALQSGGNPSDQGSQLTAQSVPEPISLLPLLTVGLFLRRRRIH